MYEARRTSKTARHRRRDARIRFRRVGDRSLIPAAACTGLSGRYAARITDRTELGAHLWERNFFVDEYGDKYPQEIGLDNSTNNGENKWKFHYQPDAYIGRADINGCAHGAFLRWLRNIDRETKRITLMVAGAFDERNETEGWYDGSLTKRLNGVTVSPVSCGILSEARTTRIRTSTDRSSRCISCRAIRDWSCSTRTANDAELREMKCPIR